MGGQRVNGDQRNGLAGELEGWWQRQAQREIEANPNVDESDIPRSMTPDVMRR